MAGVPVLYFVLNDEKNQKSVVEFPVEAPAIGDYPLALAALSPLLRALVDGGLVAAGVRLEVDLTGWNSIGVAGADVQEKGFFGWLTEGGFPKNFTIPTIKESLFLPGSKFLNTANTALAAFITAIEDGFTPVGASGLVTFSDYRGDDIVTLTEAREAWGKYRRS